MLYSVLIRRIWIACVLLISGHANAETVDPLSQFWKHWSDGSAEVSAYRLTQPRYGEPREGYAFLIYVTEPFSRSKRIKVNRYNAQNPDHTIALKLNIIESWQTGMYHYRLMTSYFFDTQSGLAPIKVSFSSQEWCGMTFEEGGWSSEALDYEIKSYFEGESQTKSLPKEVVMTDQLLVWGRGLQIGGPAHISKVGPLATTWISSPKLRRLQHQPLQVYQAQPRLGAQRLMNTSLGSLMAIPLTFKRMNRDLCTLHIEVKAPHRVLGWQCDQGEKAELINQRRIPYWKYTQTRSELLLHELINPK